MKYLVPLTLFLCCFLSKAVAQDNVIRKSIFFPTGQYALSPKHKEYLTQWLDSLDKSINYKLVLLGNTDSTGSKALNQRLSKLRAQATKNHLTAMGLRFSLIVTGAGKKSMAANNTKKEQAKNRRVDIIILPSTENISALYKKLEKQPQAFCINPTRDTVLAGDNGTIISIKANTFTAPTKGCITIRLKEFYSNANIILGNLTTLSNNRMLETQGMMYLEAIYDNKQLTPLKPISILMPNKEQINGSQLFYGEEHDNHINWVATNQPIEPYNLNVETLIGCMRNCGQFLPDSTVYDTLIRQRDTLINQPANKAVTPKIASSNCHSIWCRVGRFFSSIFSSKKNKQEAKKEEQQFVKVNKTITDTVIVERKVVRNLEQLQISFFLRIIETSGIVFPESCKNMLKQLEAMNIKTMEEFKMAVQKAVKNKTATPENFFGYMITVSKLGYVNCDAFLSYDRSRLTNIYVDEIPNTNISARLVFRKSRTVVPFGDAGIEYACIAVPKDEEAWVVALKYHNQQPYLSLQLIKIEENLSVRFNFKQTTFEQMERELQTIEKRW